MNDFMSTIINDLNSRFVEFYGDTSINTVGMYADISNHRTQLLAKPHDMPEEIYRKIMDIYEDDCLFPSVGFRATVTDGTIHLCGEVLYEKSSKTINTFYDYRYIKNFTTYDYDLYWKETRKLLQDKSDIIRSIDVNSRTNLAHEIEFNIWSMLRSLNTLVLFDSSDWVLPLNGNDCRYYFKPDTRPVLAHWQLTYFIGEVIKLYYTK